MGEGPTEEKFAAWLRRMEEESGRPLHADARARMWANFRARNSPMQRFLEQLKTRQGTTFPDFDALYKRKAELDGDDIHL